MAHDTQPTADPTLPLVACRHLRSKGMYITGCMNPAEDDREVGDGNCWCGQTQHVIGPDDGLVDRPACTAATRACFEPLL